MLPLEFQAVVLAAGRGSRFPDLTEGRPKCLLPVGPLPLIFYPLNLLQRHGFQDVILVVIESQKAEIQQQLEHTPLTIRVEYFTVPAEHDYGTADTLRLVGDKIKSDLLVVSCDIVSNVSLYPLINKFRQHDATLVALLMKSCDEDAVVPGPKSKEKPERDLILTNCNTNRLIFSASLSDFEEKVSLPAHLFRSNGKVQMDSKLLDAHVYIMKRWVLEFLQDSNQFSTMKGELLPYIVKKQMSQPLNLSDPGKFMSESNVNPHVDDIFTFVSHSTLAQKIAETSLYSEEKHKPNKSYDCIRCYAVKAPLETFAVRVNTLRSFCAANQKVPKIPELFDKKVSLIHPNAVVESNQVTDCSIGENSKINAKTSLKTSIIGQNCVVNAKVRVTDTILMNNVELEEGVVLQNCVVCDKAVIKKGSVLTNCLVGFNFTVPEGTKKEKTNFTTSSTNFMEI
ncbi:translation initiation factor eIF2B subunit gamma [Culicoides brevitarsis]|uniref:translation initiation factor eIF2B subunit gamma n=1 Tax=Culicoides brevitarsis TaxID=469753 RepID=UPI00307B41F3